MSRRDNNPKTNAPDPDLAADIKTWFERAVPSPSDRNRGVQIGCHYEEVGEMAHAAGDEMLASELNDIATLYKRNVSLTNSTPDHRKELLDAICDQVVTAIGIGHMFGMDVMGALAEVNRSNWSKFVDGKPIFDENGKIKKGPNYTPPDLEAFLG